MALPSEISLVAMTGSLVDDSGNPLQGFVTLTPSEYQLISASTDTIIELNDREIQLDEFGQFTVSLIPSGETDIAPHGVVWSLTLPGDSLPALQFAVPSDVTSANIVDNIVTSFVGNEPTYFFGYRGPQGEKGQKGDPGPAGYDDTALAARVAALETAPLLRRIVHDGTSYAARPAGVAAGLVEYVGPTEPTDWLTGDTWVERI